MYSLDIRDLPIIKADVSLYKYLLPLFQKGQHGEHWLLYNNVHSPFHVITNIRKLFGAYF